MTLPSPFTFPAVDTIKLGGDTMPGQWILQPTAKEYGWQIQKGWGQAGASVMPVGDELVVATFLVRFHRAHDWAAFQPYRMKYLQKALVQRGGQATYALSIEHPELQALGVVAVVPRKTPVFTNNGKGLWTGTVEFLQFRLAKPMPEQPRAQIPAAPEPTPSSEDALNQAGAAHQDEVEGARG